MSSLDIQREIDEVEVPAPKRAVGRDFACPVCGQMLDRLNLAQMDHHTDQPHEPLTE
jgi:hypothetical protein